jgi:hypothetical protein
MSPIALLDPPQPGTPHSSREQEKSGAVQTALAAFIRE